MDIKSYDAGREMALCGVAWRIRGIHELEGLISDEARVKIFDFLRREADLIGPDAVEEINRIDGKVKS